MKFQWKIMALKIGLKEAFTYRMEFFTNILSSALMPAAIQMLFWYAIFHINGATSFHAFSKQEMLGYTLASMLFTQVRGGDLDFAVQEMIRTGQLSNFLLRPISFIEFILIDSLS